LINLTKFAPKLHVQYPSMNM